MDRFISTVNAGIMSANVSAPIFVYVGIGTAAGTYTMDGNQKVVALDNYHQYPKVLHDMESVLQSYAKKYILLIDPCLEDPPHITQDEKNGFLFKKQADNVFVDFGNLIHLHVMRVSCTHDAYNMNGQNLAADVLNLTQNLSALIEVCKSNYVNMIYHDFSGRPLLPIYDYHATQIGEHSNHIIIGLGAQGDFGCYFDLQSPIATFAMTSAISKHNRKYANICSPRYYLENRMTIDKALIDYAECPLAAMILREQFTRVCKDRFNELVSRVFYKLRFLKQLVLIPSNEVNNITLEDLCQMFDQIFAETVLQRINEQNFDIAFIEALELYGPKFDILCINFNLNMSGVDLLYQITTDAKDQYSWATELRKYVNY